MDETHRQGPPGLQFVRQQLGRIVVGALLVAMVYCAMTVVFTYQREKRIAEKVKALGGDVAWEEACGPGWIPYWLQKQIPFFDGIIMVSLDFVDAPADVLVDLESLTNIVCISLNGLTFLDGHHKRLTDTDLEHFKRLTNLKTLCICESDVTDAGLEHLSGLPRLTLLSLNQMKITDAGLMHLKNLPSLETLGLTETQVTDAGLESLQGLNKLTCLQLHGTKVTGDGLELLIGLPLFQTLYLNNTKITDAGLEHLKGLTSLTSLVLDDTQLTNAGFEHLKEMTHLTYIDLNNTQTTPEGREMLRKALPKCQIEPNP